MTFYRKAMYLWTIYSRAPSTLVPVLEEEGCFVETPRMILRALRNQNDHADPWTQNVHRCLQEALRWRPRFAPVPELDEIAAELDTSAAAGEAPMHVLQSLAEIGFEDDAWSEGPSGFG